MISICNKLVMEGEGLLRALMEMAKKGQEQRDTQKIQELEESQLQMHEEYQRLKGEYKMMKENF